MRKTINEETWKRAIEEGKKLVQLKENNQLKIAALALSVCEIGIQGGRKDRNKNRFTINDFSKGIGLHESTVHTWIAQKRNVFDKLDKSIQSKVLYKDIYFVHKLVSKSTPREEVKKRVLERINTNGKHSPELKMRAYLVTLKTIAYNFEERSVGITLKTQTLEEIKYYIDKIASHLKNVKAKNHYIVSVPFTKLNGQYTDWKITEKDKKVLEYVKDRKVPIGPTEIGSKAGKRTGPNASSWALSSLVKWVDLGKITKTRDGLYQVKT
jgi:hypothetical protein